MLKERVMKDVELRLISELMKNSRRSDRDLAKAIEVPQPTVTRIKTKLEREDSISVSNPQMFGRSLTIIKKRKAEISCK